MRKIVEISKPYIKKVYSDIFGKAVRLCADVTMKNPNTHKNESKVCYFEFEERFEKYLCSDRSDAFVTGLLSTAMENNMDIKFVAPISERLYYGLSTYYIPMVSKNNSSYPLYSIKIEGPTDNNIIKNEKAVATGCSGGVDSFYTIAKHSDSTIKNEHKLTHLVYNSIGFDVDNKESSIKEVFKRTKKEIELIAKDCNLDTISCYTNLYEFYFFPYKAFNTFSASIYSSVAFALQKLISIYYLSSGAIIADFNLNLTKAKGHDSSVFDIFSLSCLDSENIKFYSTGMECERIEKEKYIADYKAAQSHLAVCAYWYLQENKGNVLNCSICKKCLRTMCHFYSLGKLENFKDVFDVNNFISHKTKYIGKFMGQDIKQYVYEFKKEMANNKINIPIGSYFYAYLFYKPIKFIRSKFKDSPFARKIYYKLNLDYKLNGFHGPLYDRYKNEKKSK